MKKLIFLILTPIMLLLVGCGGGGGGSTLESLIPGHKYYVVDDDEDINGSKVYNILDLEFTTNGKNIITNENNATDKETYNYKIDGNTISFTSDGEDGEEKELFAGKNSEGIILTGTDGKDPETLYFTKQSAQKAIEKMKEQDSNSMECEVSGDTVLVDEGATCKYKEHTAVCENNYVTVDNTFTGKQVKINGTTYTCN